MKESLDSRRRRLGEIGKEVEKRPYSKAGTVLENEKKKHSPFCFFPFLSPSIYLSLLDFF